MLLAPKPRNSKSTAAGAFAEICAQLIDFFYIAFLDAFGFARECGHDLVAPNVMHKRLRRANKEGRGVIGIGIGLGLEEKQPRRAGSTFYTLPLSLFLFAAVLALARSSALSESTRSSAVIFTQARAFWLVLKLEFKRDELDIIDQRARAIWARAGHATAMSGSQQFAAEQVQINYVRTNALTCKRGSCFRQWSATTVSQ